MIGLLFDGETKIGSFECVSFGCLYNVTLNNQYINISGRESAGKLKIITAYPKENNKYELIQDYKIHKLNNFEGLWVNNKESRIDKASICE